MSPTKHHSSPSTKPNKQPIDFLAGPDYDTLGKRKMPDDYIDFFALESQLSQQQQAMEIGTDDVSLTQLTLGRAASAGPSHTRKKKSAVVVSAPPLRQPNDEIDYEITKTLKDSDVDGSSRFLVKKLLAEKHILPHVMSNWPHFDELKGVELGVFDVDTRSNHLLVFKKWKSTGSFVLCGNWVSDFVKRRGLKVDDIIGLRWSAENLKLEFKLLNNNN
ncbi:hypothetical protein Sango_0415600 [Sesamum angolense]|uniref:B3 domain-containing protein n=1 Tax=Sesamum angolense TaxID=2727404 RepID=A0AAE1XB77_9LAMI|nr:hypothetical protein Sango_0415600 [Sesamum angolense]